MKKHAIVAYVKGSYAGLTVLSLIDSRDTGDWAKPLNSEYEKVAFRKAVGYVPIGIRQDRNVFRYIV